MRRRLTILVAACLVGALSAARLPARGQTKDFPLDFTQTYEYFKTLDTEKLLASFESWKTEWPRARRRGRRIPDTGAQSSVSVEKSHAHSGS